MCHQPRLHTQSSDEQWAFSNFCLSHNKKEVGAESDGEDTTALQLARTRGTCGDGYEPITTKANCDKAAKALGEPMRHSRCDTADATPLMRD